MKSKMKSTFAIIAVALMIMVAVVPMVGVFTSESDAAFTYDPTISGSKKITIKGNVYNVNGGDVTPVADANNSGYLMLITWGSSAQYYTTAYIDNGAYQVTLDESSITNVKVSVVYGSATDYEATTEFGDAISFATMKTGTYVANFKSGYSNTGVVTFYVATTDGTNKYYSVFNLVDATAEEYLAVEYTLYDSDNVETRNKIGEGKVAINSDSTATIPYQGVYDNVYAVFGDTYIMTAAGSTKTTYSTTSINAGNGTEGFNVSTDVNAITDQKIFRVNVNSSISIPVGALENMTGYYITSGDTPEKKTVSMTLVQSNSIYSGADAAHSSSIAYIYNMIDVGTTAEPSMKKATAFESNLTWGSVKVALNTNTTTEYADSASYTITKDVLKTNKVFFGTFAMENGTSQKVPAYDGQKLTMKIAEYTAATETTAAKYTDKDNLTVTVNGGNYVAYKKDPVSTQKYMYVDADGFTVASIGGKALNTTGDWTKYTAQQVSDFGENNIIVSPTGYTYVSGKIEANSGTAAADKIGVSLGVQVSGISKAFGYSVSSGKIAFETTVVGGESTFKFFVATNDEITFAPGAKETFTFVNPTQGPFIVVSGMEAKTIKIAPKYMVFKVSDSDGANLISDTNKIVINYAQYSALSYAFSDAGAAGSIAATLVSYDATEKTCKATIYKSYVDITGAEFWPTLTVSGYAYTFPYDEDSPATYTLDKDAKYMTLSSLDKTYYVYFKDAHGNVVKSIEGGQSADTVYFDAKLYNVFNNESGNFGYELCSPAVTYAVNARADGGMTVYFPSIYNNVTVPSATVTEKAVLLTPKNLDTYITNAYYLFSADKDTNTMIITAKQDSITGKLVRMDGVTGIAGALVKDAADMGDVKNTATTDAKGEFTINLDATATAATRIYFSLSGYTFTAGYPVLEDDKKITTYESTGDLYMVTVSDGTEIVDLLAADKLKIAGVEASPEFTYEYDYVMMTLSLEPNMIVTPELKGVRTLYKSATDVTGITTVADSTLRTFSPVTITPTMVSTGIIGLQTNESVYTVEITDADGAAFNLAAINTLETYTLTDGIYKTVMDYTLDANNKYKAFIGAAGWVAKGTYSVVLSKLTDEKQSYVVRDVIGNNEAVTAANNKDGNYIMPVTYTAYDDDEAIIVSPYAKIAFAVADAAGEVITLDYVPGTLNAAGTEITSMTVRDSDKYYNAETVHFDKADNILYFYGSPILTYKNVALANVIIDDIDPTTAATLKNSGYEIKASAAISNGIIKTKQQTVVFSFIDADEKPIAGENATVNAYDGGSTVVEGFEVVGITGELGLIAGIAVVDKKYVYSATIDGYTFDYTDGFVFTAKESTVTPTFVTANGLGLDDMIVDDAVVSAKDAFGNVLDWAAIGVDDDGDIFIGDMIVDKDNVACYEIEGTPIVGVTFGTSLLPLFVANETYITGTVPYTGGAMGEVVLNLYLLDSLVGQVEGVIDEDYKNTYEAFIDLSNYIPDDAVGAIAFDSIVAVYSEGGVVLAVAEINPYSVVNNILSEAEKTVVKYEVTLSAPSALIARHVSIAQVGNTATVSADAKFIVSDDEAIYTDGQYIYTFAGWYVDNELVSHNAVFTFTATEEVVIAPAYTVAYEKISDVNTDVEPKIIVEEVSAPGLDNNVLIIGIVAVIVALIAVVYAVIKKE